MAGKPKRGLDFYYQPTDLLEDIKIRRILKEHKSEGYAVYSAIVTWIYQKGQFWKFDSIEDVVFLLSESLYLDEAKVLNIINFLVENNIFDKKSFNKGYLTSKEIQHHYYYATKRRKVRILKECLLLSQEEMDEIDNKKRIDVNNDSIVVNKDVIDVDKDKQSNSNSKSKKNDKRMINNDIGMVDPRSLPFNLNYYLKVLIDNKIVVGTEEWIEDLNDFLYEIIKKYNKEDIKKAIYYTIKRIEHNKWKDELGHEIVNKEPYLRTTIENNIIRNENFEEKTYDNDFFKNLFKTI